LNNYFDDLATLTNNNFFSKDTIFDKKYIFPNYISEIKLSEANWVFGFNNNFWLLF